MKHIILGMFLGTILGCFEPACAQTYPAAVLETIGHQVGKSEGIHIALCESEEESYSVKASDGEVYIRASSPSAACYGFYSYYKQACGGMITWNGKHLPSLPAWPDWEGEGRTPYRFRYFLNVCTFGYTAPYWDWNRWEQEIEMMALHGVNLPLCTVAAEAIARRVWIKLGLSDEDLDRFFTGPAFLPWHRMGNLNAWSGPLDGKWHENQIALQHAILEKMRSLGMEPIAPAFAGFVPSAYLQQHPALEASLLPWGGMDTSCNASILSPYTPEFQEIGKLFVQEWEKEFGQARYWLSDSFNEMTLPVEEDDREGKCRVLAEYGKAIYSSIASGHPGAVWVTQGWTFGARYKFWDKESVQALFSKVPDDGLLIVDLANDYPAWVWHIDPVWQQHEGFYGKPWIYSFTPNFGGKNLPTGDMKLYATGYASAYASPQKGNLSGVGAAPEGLENNDVVYELLSDAAWSTEPVDLDRWYEQWCKARYGSSAPALVEAWQKFHESVYCSLYSYPRFTWQTIIPDKRRKSRHEIGEDFSEGVALLQSCKDICTDSPLYQADVAEFSAYVLGAQADNHWTVALEKLERGDRHGARKELARTEKLLLKADDLLAAVPHRTLREWVAMARSASDNPTLQDRYEADAKRILTVWGGAQEDYAARMWSGLIREYYIPRLRLFVTGSSEEEIRQWEEAWVASRWKLE